MRCRLLLSLRRYGIFVCFCAWLKIFSFLFQLCKPFEFICDKMNDKCRQMAYARMVFIFFSSHCRLPHNLFVSFTVYWVYTHRSKQVPIEWMECKKKKNSLELETSQIYVVSSFLPSHSFRLFLFNLRMTCVSMRLSTNRNDVICARANLLPKKKKWKKKNIFAPLSLAWSEVSAKKEK